LPPKNPATAPRTESNEEPLQSGEIAVPKALGGGNHDALHQNDSELAAGSPKIATTVVKHEQGGRRVQRFDGRIASSEFGSRKNARTVSVVASKHPTAYQKLSERFVLGGREKTRINFHVGCHCTDTIIGLGFFKHGKVWFNGFPIDSTLSEFAPKLAVIWFVAGRNTVTGQFARDRDFIDRCWHGHIGEGLI
jgi:hypothetical protein